MNKSGTSAIPTAWAKFWGRIQKWEEAASITHADIQDRRLAHLEREISALKAAMSRINNDT